MNLPQSNIKIPSIGMYECAREILARSSHKVVIISLELAPARIGCQWIGDLKARAIGWRTAGVGVSGLIVDKIYGRQQLVASQEWLSCILHRILPKP
jgi:hypothetical protein